VTFHVIVMILEAAVGRVAFVKEASRVFDSFNDPRKAQCCPVGPNSPYIQVTGP
jgi:hypothetical protein